MKKLLKPILIATTLLASSSFAFAQTPPNDSCAIYVAYGAEHYWICDSGIFQGTQDHSFRSTETRALQAILKKMHLPDSRTVTGKSTDSVPNDSCAMSVSFAGGKDLNYYRCDSGIYRVMKKKKLAISSELWNKKIEQIDLILHERN